MDMEDLRELLAELVALPTEEEWVEFKHNYAGAGQVGEYVGEYLSALSNSAALLGRPRGYIVWGVEDGTRRVVGTSFKPRSEKIGNEELENWPCRSLHPSTDIRLYQFSTADNQAVTIIEVQAANSTPVRFKDTEFIRVGSLKKKLKDYPEKERELWRFLTERMKIDWSAQVCENASLADLDPNAVSFARRQYQAKNPDLTGEIGEWDDATFLNKAKVCIAGKITRTALLLLGKAESTHFLSPAVARITWLLQDAGSGEPAYQHFDSPFLLNVDAAFARVRNVTIQPMSGLSLFPVPVSKYDAWVVREALHNAIAHQDYTQGGKINFVEEDDSLLLTNLGHFIPESVEQVIAQDAPPERYRNPFLANAMVNLNMIDTIGSGIRRMFRKQRERSLPCPTTT
jgi:ATP-dependent DNA helicase RecG